MAERMTVRIDGVEVQVADGVTVAAAILNSGLERFRTSTEGAGRGPLCGMGICFECRVTIDGHKHQRACMVTCTPGMEVETGG